MPPQRPAPAPSISHTNNEKVTNITGQRSTGAIARAESAPATKAMAARRQPQASTMEWARRVRLTTGARLSSERRRHLRARPDDQQKATARPGEPCALAHR